MTGPGPTQGIFRNEGAGEETSLCFFLFSLLLQLRGAIIGSENNVPHSSS